MAIIMYPSLYFSKKRPGGPSAAHRFFDVYIFYHRKMELQVRVQKEYIKNFSYRRSFLVSYPSTDKTPSFIVRVTSVRVARSLSCVTTITHLSSAFESFSRMSIT